MKRFHARGRGRSATVEKWFSHLKIVVAEREPVEKPQRDTKPGRSKSTTPVASSKAAVEPAGETA
jgi:large subunit ribosomal protein L22